jgi:hypothetical protein
MGLHHPIGEIVYQRWAELLGHRASKVFRLMSGLSPDSLEIVEADINSGPRYPLGVRVNFYGRDQEGLGVSGFFVCAFESVESAGDIASAIAAKMGLSPPAASDVTGIDNVLGEFLNTVIGLTCSEWADHGLTTEFDPPLALSRHESEKALACSKAFHLTMATDKHSTVSIFLVFLSGGETPG